MADEPVLTGIEVGHRHRGSLRYSDWVWKLDALLVDFTLPWQSNDEKTVA